jgi:hypothetical protein
MFDLLIMAVVHVLLSVYFLVDKLTVTVLPQAVYPRVWFLYDWLYRAAVRIAPYEIPPVYEGMPY